MDFTRQIKLAISSGKLLFGQRQTKDACANGTAKLIIFAANCPRNYIEEMSATHPEVTMHQTMNVNRELGTVCGKPFSVSTICILDAGESDLLTLDSNL